MKYISNNLRIILFSVITIAIFANMLEIYEILRINNMFLLGLRWIAIAFLLYYTIRKKSLTTSILISMIVGAEVGYDFPEFAVKLQLISKIFIRMIKTIIAPLLFATLVFGIAGHADLKQVGRMGWKSIVYFEVVSTIALFIGLAAINISEAGVGVKMALPEMTDAAQHEVKRQTFSETVLHVFPENIAKSIAEGQVLQIVVFSIIFGLAVAMMQERLRRPMITFCESFSEAMFKFTSIVMYFAPVAVGAAIAYSVGHMGMEILFNLFKLLATLYVALIAFLVLVLLPIALMFRIPVLNFIRAVA